MRGSVVDIHFSHQLPPIYSLLRAGDAQQIVIEVLAQHDAHHVRVIAMSHTTADLRRKMNSARDLQAVVHTMKAMAAVSVCQYEQAVQAGYAPTHQRFLPLDAQWCRQLAERPWPTNNLPEVIGTNTETLQTLIREYLFVSLFRACAKSLASENTRRLAAMQRADRNIAERLEFPI